MDFYMKLPRNKKEFILFMIIISIISVNIIAPLITCFEIGFYLSVWFKVIKIIPFIWFSVILIVLITYIPSEKLTHKILNKDDSFNSHIIVNTLFSVFFISIFMTIIGTWIATCSINLNPIYNFFYKWPRNFSISLFIELLIAQPIARFIIYRLHLFLDKKNSK